MISLWLILTIITGSVSLIASLIFIAIFWEDRNGRYEFEKNSARSAQRSLKYTTTTFLFCWAWPVLIPLGFGMLVRNTLKAEVK